MPYTVTNRKNGSTVEIFHKDCERGLKEDLKQNSIDVVITLLPTTSE